MRSGKTNFFDLADTVIATIPIAIGASIYLLFRGRGILIFKIVDAIGIGSSIQYARQATRPLNPCLNSFALYSLPSGLWAFSFIFCIVTIWQREIRSFDALTVIMLTVIVVLGSELAQAMNLLSGRFDTDDFIANAMGLGLGGIVAYAKQSNQKIQR